MVRRGCTLDRVGNQAFWKGDILIELLESQPTTHFLIFTTMGDQGNICSGGTGKEINYLTRLSNFFKVTQHKFEPDLADFKPHIFFLSVG